MTIHKIASFVAAHELAIFGTAALVSLIVVFVMAWSSNARRTDLHPLCGLFIFVLVFFGGMTVQVVDALAHRCGFAG